MVAEGGKITLLRNMVATRFPKSHWLDPHLCTCGKYYLDSGTINNNNKTQRTRSWEGDVVGTLRGIEWDDDGYGQNTVLNR